MILSRVVKKAAGKLEKRPAEAPKTSMDMVFTLAEAIRFGYAETLGKWNLLDLPRAIFYGIMEKGKKTVAIECKERDDCVELKDPEILKELYEIKKCLTRTMLFSKKRFRAFLFAAGFIKGDVLLRKRRARILKPAFSVIRDKESKCLFVFIRGTRSIKDTLTDAIGAPVSFNHFVYSDGELKRNNVISGHGHRGMVAAARWIKKHCTPKLLDELCQYPDFQVKILGHSLGGGTAALLTFMLREIKQFSSCTCVTFGPAACMSMEMAEFGKPFITSIINGYDMVPTLSAASVHDFIHEGLNKRKIFIKSACSAIGSRIPFASNAKAIADHAVSRGTEAVMKSKQRTRSLIGWSKRENAAALTGSKSENLAEAARSSNTSYEGTEEFIISEFTSDEDDGSISSGEGSDNDDMDEEEKEIIAATHNLANDELNEYYKELKLDTQEDNPEINGGKGKEEAIEKGITEGELKNDKVVHSEETADSAVATSEKPVRHHLYPPGRILHIVPVLSSENSKPIHYDDADAKRVLLYETGRELYGKLRLSRGMLFDHMTSKYLKVFQQLINQFEKEM
ncbi:hypothetical protein VIGAN_10117400 [Vigna angularis var. angularis]|uniref:Fungal lipase-type domain-containing protein n=1 Tax=Vigna angularis var. angularis TaxID=157739 RepID=A0A0S3T3K1_PHAAN|nr:uncharacterized protein LOC108334864 [Vigna angularis]BAT99675.1 hypothetical protein VIGAN_10117400 [Vigna angularis var. angularis]